MLGTLGADNPFDAVSFGAMPARVLAGSAPKLSMTSIDDFKLNGDAKYQPMIATMSSLWTGAPANISNAALTVTRSLTAAKPLTATPYQPANGAASSPS
jgi:hypothetical protein